VQSYTKNLNEKGEEIDEKDFLEKSPEEDLNANRVIKLGKEARSMDIKLEQLQEKSVSGGSRQSIKTKNDPPFSLLSAMASETKTGNFFQPLRPTTPVNYNQPISSFKEIKDKEKDFFEVEKFSTINTQIKLKSHKTALEKQSSNNKNKSPFSKNAGFGGLVSLRELLNQKTPEVPYYSPQSRSISPQVHPDFRRQSTQSQNNNAIFTPFSKLVKRVIETDSTRDSKADLMNISTYNMGYNLDETMAYLDRTLLDEEREERETPTNLSNLITDKPDLKANISDKRRKSKQVDSFPDFLT
jgi:hypothetical protein